MRDGRLDRRSERAVVAQRLGADRRAFDHIGPAPTQQLDLLLPPTVSGDGDGVASQRGYWHGSSMTSACFVPVAGH